MSESHLTQAQAYPLSLIRHKVSALDAHLYVHVMKLFLLPHGEWSKGWAKEIRAVLLTCTRLTPKSGRLDADFWMSTLFIDADPRIVTEEWSDGDYDAYLPPHIRTASDMFRVAQRFVAFWQIFVPHAVNAWLVPRTVPTTQDIQSFFLDQA